MSSLSSAAAISIFLFISFSSYASICTAFNISKVLESYPDFSTFNNLLNQTNLVTTINSRRTITVLVVDNGAMGGISGMSLDEQRNVLRVHVVLDYYDNDKFSKMKRKWRILTTLFQTTGMANGKQGFLNVSRTENGIVFKSAVPEADVTASLVGSVASQPYNLSVLQVSNVIVPPEISTDDDGNGNNSTAPPKAPSPKKAPSPDSDEAASPPEPDVDYDYSDSPSDTPAPAPVPAGKKKSSADTRFGVSVGLCIGAAMMWSMVVGM